MTWEFGLDPNIAQRLWIHWFNPTTDCFASSIFHLKKNYFSFFPDPNAAQRDAFSVIRWPRLIYAFPPVPWIPLTLEKIRKDNCKAIMIVPHWESAKWWDVLHQLLLDVPLPLGDHRAVLITAQDRRLPYMGHLVACLLGNSSHS